MISKENKLFLNGILIFSILSLSIAYFIQYVLGHKPCNLCLIERIPYIASVILISFIFIINRFDKIISIIILLFFIFAAIVSFYHFGIEQGFFIESFVCESKNVLKSLSKEQLLEQLKQNNVSCKDVSFTILGLSLATINIVLSFILSLVFLILFINYRGN